ncbi:MAG: hypothetical protein ACLUIQ_02635 [Dialister invisus]
MEVNDRSWYVVRNTPGAAFNGTTTKPIPLLMKRPNVLLRARINRLPRQMLKYDTIKITCDCLLTAAPWC